MHTFNCKINFSLDFFSSLQNYKNFLNFFKKIKNAYASNKMVIDRMFNC